MKTKSKPACKSSVSFDYNDLPEDIIIDILLRLGVKSLRRSECVSKSWKTLIRQPSFINRHIKRQPSYVILFHQYAGNPAIMPSINKFTTKVSRCSARFGDDRVVETFPHWYLRLEGSDNGVLCLAEGENCVFLWNPETTELKALPSPPSCHWQNPFYLHGLGYDSLTGDIKVVRVCAENRNNGECLNLFNSDNQVSVYSLRRNSWKILGMPEILSSALASKHFSSCVRSNDRRSVVVNGSIHWMLHLEGGNEGQDSELMIVAFDLSTEVFKLIDPPRQLLKNRPPLLGEYDGYSYSIDKLSECLSMVFAMEIQKSYFEIWVMEKYGVSKSWTRRVKVDLKGVHCPLDALKVKDRRKSFSSRPVLIEFSTFLIWYDLESHKLRYLTFKDEEVFAFTTYTESLIHILGS